MAVDRFLKNTLTSTISSLKPNLKFIQFDTDEGERMVRKLHPRSKLSFSTTRNGKAVGNYVIMLARSYLNDRVDMM